jgi:uncharacterized membrane protein
MKGYENTKMNVYTRQFEVKARFLKAYTKEALSLTKEMMTGDKWNTFVLGLSFIGWELLGLLTCCILNVFYVSPYTYLTFAELYKVLKNKITDPRFKEPTLMDASYQEPVYTYTGSSDSSENPYL